MELEKLQQEKIDGIDFAKKIDKETENVFIENYQKLGIDGLTKTFFIDLEIFKEILVDNENKKFCKFYYIQKGGSLNLGLSFSDNDQCPIKSEDKKYILNDKSIIKEDFTNMKNDFMNGIGAKLPNHPENKKDTLISYSLKEINNFLEQMKGKHLNIYALKLNMFQYSPTDIKHEFSAHFIERDKRIAFCVHALFDKKEDLYGESEGYDLGNLRP
ncbi:hypothetical protein L1276_003044 [Flavobacterium sp. HSC-32F16]|uniref:hypothetical protein n=1 Tax=Flavobacterium sp. HSC-32F16 TaxID=2910964 RepID=UPI0020A34BE0|nr:hypothetical protein [Flavobacterium sp. HSC-32F16]MCP2027884.1 hypothetical protein [Flavobacterium sp. HSC-32F16]